jgi:hypothetical protein
MLIWTFLDKTETSRLVTYLLDVWFLVFTREYVGPG